LASPDAVAPGDRDPWRKRPTSFNWDEALRPSAQRAAVAAPGWASAASLALEQVDTFIGKLGKPIGVASYKPYQSSGEDFLHDYLGNIGIPIELSPQFPAGADLVLLTESAAHDPTLIERIERKLRAGGKVVITSGLLRALQGKGIEDLIELEHT